MIPHTHLRAGNIVKGIPFQLAFLKGEPMEQITLTAQDIYLLEAGKHEVFGVELTEDMLLRYGFIKDYSRLYLDLPEDADNVRFEFHISSGECESYIPSDSTGFGKTMLYLHEVQNRYFALTGEGLTLSATLAQSETK